MNYGWWITIVLGIGWSYFIYRDPQRGRLAFGTTVVVGVLAFIWGVLAAVHATGSVPQVIQQWGKSDSACHAIIDTRRLTVFRKRYDLALACGIGDASKDKLTDRTISTSSLFTIIHGGVAIQASYSKDMATIFAARPNQIVEMWYEAILIPKGADMSVIRSLASRGPWSGRASHGAGRGRV